MKLRGPGDFFGTHQHGLPAFKLADLTRDMQLLQTAQQMSKSIIESDPQLKRADHRIMRELTQRLMQRGAEMT